MQLVQESMLGKVLEALLRLTDEILGSVLTLCQCLAGENGRMWFAELKRFLRKEVCWFQILHIDRSKPFDPVTLLSQGWSIAEEDENSLKLAEIDLALVRLEHMLKKGEPSVLGEEKLKRLKKARHIRLDARVLQTLWEDQSKIPESWKRETNDHTTFIYFDGTVLRGSDGRRYVLCLYWRNGRWNWLNYWLGYDWYANNPSAVLAA